MTDIAIQFGFIVGILAYGFVQPAFIPGRWHFVANLAAAAVAVGFGLLFGLSFTQMGMGLGFIPRGLLYALIVSLVVILGTFAVASVPRLRQYFAAARQLAPNHIAYETAVRIPLSTALSEEILFRGVLLGVLLQFHGVWVSIFVGSLVFGVWHVLPALRQASVQLDPSTATNHRILFTLATVATTGLAGVCFSWLRIAAGSIVAPWLLHWSINSSAMLASALVLRLHHKEKSKT